MRLEDAITDNQPIARRMLEYAISRGENGMPHLVALYRGDDHVALLVIKGDSTTVVPAAQLAILGLDADLAVVITDSYTVFCDRHHDQADIDGLLAEADWCPHLINPTTGRKWGRGEMEKVAREHDGVAKGWVHEILCCNAFNRAGDVASVVMPYQRAGIKRDRVVWTEIREWGESTGYIRDSLVGIMNTPSTTTLLQRFSGMSVQELEDRFGGWNREDRDFYTGKIISSEFGDDVHMALLAHPDDADRVRRLRAYGHQ